jgi:hypothetical protein
VVDRWIPLVSAAYGMRVARPARTAMLLTWRRPLRAWPGGGGPSSVTSASLARAWRARGSSGTRPRPLQALLIASPRVRCSGPEQALRRLPIPACTGLSRLFADAPVSKLVSIGFRSCPVTKAAVDPPLLGRSRRAGRAVRRRPGSAVASSGRARCQGKDTEFGRDGLRRRGDPTQSCAELFSNVFIAATNYPISNQGRISPQLGPCASAGSGV